MPVRRSTLSKIALVVAVLTTSPAIADEADAHFSKGRTAFNAGKFDDALREFQAAWSTRKTHDLAASMAQAEMQLGRYPAAAEHLTYALRHFPVSAKEDVRKKMEGALAEARGRVAALKITVSVDGAEVLVDGVAVGRAPLEQDVFVQPGAHKIEARLPKHVTAAKDVNVAKGASEAAALTLVPEAAPTPTVMVTTTATATAEPPRSKVPGYVIGGVGAAAAIAGGVLLGAGFAMKGDVAASEPRGADGKPLCARSADAGPELHPDCPAIRGKLADAQTMANAGLPVLIVGGVSLAVAAGYLLWPEARASAASPVSRIVPVASPQGAALIWTGSF